MLQFVPPPDTRKRKMDDEGTSAAAADGDQDVSIIAGEIT